ncbi:MAG: hypothetical protein OCC45_10590 [Desulfotalea sp.]
MSKFFFRILSALFGVILLGGVTWLGFTASIDSSFVIWFGLASAILAPTGIAAISYSITAKKNEVLARLENVPEIQKLIQEAKTQEEKIKLLEQEREQLLAAVEFETRKQALISRKEILEVEASDLVSELEILEKELSFLDVEIDNSTAKKMVSSLNERIGARKRGDVVLNLGGRYMTISRDLILSLPMGRLVFSYFQFLGTWRNRTNNY